MKLTCTRGATAVSDLATTFEGAVGTVEEPSVKKAAGKASTSLSNFADEFAVIAKDPKNADTSKNTSLSTELTENFTALQKTCSN